MLDKFTWEHIEPHLITYGAAIGMGALRVLGILLIAWITIRLVRKALGKLEALMARVAGDEDPITAEATMKRARTLTTLLRTVATVGIWGVVLVMVLDQVGFQIGPLLAGAGIAGLAIGFGAQNLVRDVISGFFLILENQIRVGDVAMINGTGGLVEAITFRTVTLRDLEGVVHVFPNGTINTLANRTKGWSAYVLDLGIAYDQNTDEVVRVLKEVHAELMKDPEYGPLMLEPIEVFGVDRFGDSSVTIKCRIKTVPIRQWFVGREFLRRLKMEMDKRGIEIPFPQRTLHFGKGSNPEFTRAA